MAATKKAMAKAFDAGQAAQVYGDPDDACPFVAGSDEYDEYMRGKSEGLADKWLVRGGRRLMRVVNDQS